MTGRPGEAASHRTAHGGLPVEYLPIEKWSLEDNTARYGQEGKLWVNMAVCICLPEVLTPFDNKV